MNYAEIHTVRYLAPDGEVIEQRDYKTYAGAERWRSELVKGGVRERGERVIVETTVVEERER